MKKSVLLTAVVALLWLNVTHATVNQARGPLDFRSGNGSGIAVNRKNTGTLKPVNLKNDGTLKAVNLDNAGTLEAVNHENAGTLKAVNLENAGTLEAVNHENAGIQKVIVMDHVFVLVAKPHNFSLEKDAGKYKVKKININNGVRLDGNKLNGRKLHHGTGNREKLGLKNARWHKAPEMSLMHYSQSKRGSAVQYMGEMVSQQFIGRINPAIDTKKNSEPLNLEENEVTSYRDEGLQDDIGIRKRIRHEAILKLYKRTRAQFGTTRKRRSCLQRGGRCRHGEKAQLKMSHHGSHINETAVGDWVIIYEDVEQTNVFGRSMEASHLLRCQKGPPPEINLPINSQLTLDTRGANLDQNFECNWRLKVLDGRGLMVHCYLQRDGGGHSDTSSALTIIPSADENGLVKIERLDRRAHRGVWYFHSKEVLITYMAGRGWTEGSSSYKCDLLVK